MAVRELRPVFAKKQQPVKELAHDDSPPYETGAAEF
jgi:hypothetical protein